MRWKLTASHYLAVQGSAWEQTEVDRMTGKQLRKRYDVPLQLDIQDPTIWNGNIVRNPRGEILGGDIIVAKAEGAHESTDYIFTGDPTPDMFPLDDEAKAVSESFHKRWNARPEEDLQYGERLVQMFQEQKAESESRENIVKIEGLPEVLASMAEMMKQNQQLMASLVPANGRRA